MSNISKCPYCNKRGKLIRGRVGDTQTHFTFGWGERIWKCTSCGETWSVCFAIPPKDHSELVVGAKEILEVGMIDGIRGFASPTVIKAKITRAEISTDTPPEPVDTSDEEAASL